MNNRFWGFICLLAAACQTAPQAGQPADTAPADTAATDILHLRHDQVAEIGLQTDTFHLLRLSDRIRANGRIDLPPQQQAAVSTYADGYLVEVRGLEGDFVEKGQLLARLESSAYVSLQQSYLEALADLPHLREDWERQQRLVRDSVNAARRLGEAEAAYKQTLARLRGLEAQLRLLGLDPATLAAAEVISPRVELRAPIAGYLTSVEARIGQQAHPGDVLYEIANTQHLHAELQVFEQDLARLRKGQQVYFEVQALPGRTIRGEVYLIGKELIDEGRYVHVHCHFDEGQAPLLPGMYVQAYIEAGSALQRALPRAAVLNEAGASFIFVQTGRDDEHLAFRRVAVQTGTVEGDWIETTPLQPLPPDTRVVVSGGYYLSSVAETAEDGHAH
ncbi:MAG: efflux RND transporter periplasmic adaptor subunit [Bacteroidia bacterium]